MVCLRLAPPVPARKRTADHGAVPQDAAYLTTSADVPDTCPGPPARPASGRYDIQICVGQSTPSSNAMALDPFKVVGLAKFCTFGLAMTAQVSRANHR